MIERSWLASARARHLVRRGKLRAAIEVLSERNRERRSPTIERQLVELRHRAFYAEPHQSGCSTWPPPDPGGFADSNSIPEIEARHLTVEALRSGILGRGSLIVRGLIGAEEACRLADATRASLADYDAARDGRRTQGEAGWYDPFDARSVASPLTRITRDWVRKGGGVLAVDAPRAFFLVVDALERAGIVELLTAHFGERPALSAKKTTLREVQPGITGSWHQDGAFLGSDIRAVNVWIALTHCGVDAPSIDIVGRRLDRLVTPGTEDAAFDWSVSDCSAERAADKDPIVHPVFEPGDAILFDELCLHRTASKPGMTRTRYAIEAWCFAPSAYPVDQIPVCL